MSTPPSRPRVLLADDHSLLLEAFARLLQPDFDVVDGVTNGRRLLAAADRLEPDVVVADISMPQLNGLDACRQLRARQPGVKIVFLTVHAEPAIVAAAFRAGANAYVLKTSAASELIKAIRCSLTGNTYVTPKVIERDPEALWEALHGKSSADFTPRQREVLQLLAEGSTMKEAAGLLGITPRTVAFHKYRMMRQLAVRTTAELIRYALHRGLV